MKVPWIVIISSVVVVSHGKQVARGVGTGDDDGISAVLVAVVALAVPRHVVDFGVESVLGQIMISLLVDVVGAGNGEHRCLEDIVGAMRPLGFNTCGRHALAAFRSSEKG
ncbi:hypothetical protein HG530_012331 [Fusarium avenaceum]|nr:hypothetical protein HG530_012331 [Fusarium avenaceum]